MRPIIDGLVIPAHGEVALSPGGNHLMFMRLKEPMEAGQNRRVRLQFEKAGSIELEMIVMSADAIKAGHSSSQGHGNHESHSHD